jgi:hypothetical protein
MSALPPGRYSRRSSCGFSPRSPDSTHHHVGDVQRQLRPAPEPSRSLFPANVWTGQPDTHRLLQTPRKPMSSGGACFRGGTRLVGLRGHRDWRASGVWSGGAGVSARLGRLPRRPSPTFVRGGASPERHGCSRYTTQRKMGTMARLCLTWRTRPESARASSRRPQQVCHPSISRSRCLLGVFLLLGQEPNEDAPSLRSSATASPVLPPFC